MKRLSTLAFGLALIPIPALANEAAKTTSSHMAGTVLGLLIIGGIVYLIFRPRAPKVSATPMIMRTVSEVTDTDMQELSTNQLLLLQMNMRDKVKSSTTALMLCLFLGGIGAHEYYLGKIGRGLVYTLLCWTFIPCLISLIQLFTITGRVQRENANIEVIEVARLVTHSIKA
jgi:TM2 domain-containing membrane protein YozV